MTWENSDQVKKTENYKDNKNPITLRYMNREKDIINKIEDKLRDWSG
jgi:hypothetical protein